MVLQREKWYTGGQRLGSVADAEFGGNVLAGDVDVGQCQLTGFLIVTGHCIPDKSLVGISVHLVQITSFVPPLTS